MRAASRFRDRLCAGDRVERRVRLRRARVRAGSPGDEVTAPARAGRRAASTTSPATAAACRATAARNTAGVAALALLTTLGERRGVALHDSQRAAAVERSRRQRGERGGGGRGRRRAVRRAVADRDADHLRARRRAARRRVGARRQHRAVPLRRLRARPPRRIRPTSSGCRCPPGLTAVVVHPDLEIETAKARALLGDTVPLADADPAVGESRRVRRRAASRRLRADGAIARGSRSPSRAARRSCRGWRVIKRAAAGGRRARLQPVGIGAVALRAVPRRRRRPSASPRP